jgi:uncharacterized delta-60 repeat protein
MKRLILLITLVFCIQQTFSQFTMYMAKSSYGINGIANTYAGNSMAVLESGRILVADSNFIARYQIDGRSDLDFGYIGSYPIFSGVQRSEISISSIAIQTDGKIVVAGFLGNYPRHYFALARLLSTGQPDNTFSDDGIQIINFGTGDSYAKSVVVQSDGRILAAGYAYTDSTYNFAVARLNQNGSLDATFSNDGKVVTDFGKDEKASSMALQNDGKIVLAGFADTQIALARYNTDGSLDNTFSDDGEQTFSINGNDYKAKSVVVQSDGRLLVGGNMYDQSNHLFLARYNTDGTTDNTFSDDGILITDSSDGRSGMAVTAQPDGKILLGGGIFDGNDENFWLTRYNSDGSTDKTFGKDGIEITDVSAGNDWITGLAIQNNKLYVVGNAGSRGAAMRYTMDNNSNYYPNVDVITPSDGKGVKGSSINIEANATDIDGSITKVEFYLEDAHNKTLIGTATQRPYTCTWNNPSVAPYYKITAKATDDNSLVTTSNEVNIDIENEAKPLVR